jgi:Ca2+-binding RTX toxin-like protein
MITVKALKPTQQSQPTREDYSQPDQEKRRIVPVAFLLFLTGCAAYLKSFLPVSAEAREEQHSNKRTDDVEQNEPQRDIEISAVTDEAATEADVTAADPATRFSNNVVPIRIDLPQESGEFLAGGSRSVELASPVSLRAAVGTIGEAVRNDNRSALRLASGDGGRGSSGGASGGGGGGGGDGGGGGEDDKQRKFRAPDTPPDPLRNRAPRTSGPVQLQDTVGNQVLMISMLALLAGATDADGNQLSIAGLSSDSGTLTDAENGSWAFVPDADTRGEVRLTYTISDGSASVLQTAYFSVVEAPPIVGTAADDHLLGTHRVDTIDGGTGADIIDAREGNDTIIGGAGDDHIMAGPGNDVVYAGAGNDVVFAGAGNDIVFGGTGNDRLFGEEGDDKILGEDGDDVISGGSGVDILMAGAGNDTLQGDAGNDTLDGGDGSDNLAGGEGTDILSDGAGRDTVHGDAGDDHFLAATDSANDIYNGGDGWDTLDYSATTQGVVADLGNGTAEGNETGHDVIEGFEEVVGGSGADHISAGSAAVAISGGPGNDALEGGAGNDTISDGVGSDAVSAGGGNDHVIAAADAANDSFDGGSGQDSLDYSTATFSITIDVGSGTADGADIGHDLIASFEEVIAGSGDDHIVAGSTSISMTGGDGADTFEFQRAEGDQQTMMVRKITDFMVGDRIVAATCEISYLQKEGTAADQLSDMFSDIYLSADGDNRPVRFRFEQIDSNEVTVVDVHDRPDPNDYYSIEVLGHHQLQFTVAVA